MNKDRKAYRNINQCDTRAVVRVRINGVHESVLAPVSHHETTAHDRERENKHEHGRPGIDIVVEQVDSDIVAEFPECGPAGIFELALPEEVERKLEPDEEKEPANVTGKVPATIAIVEHGRAEVLLAISLDVVVLDMVVVIGVPRVSEHGIQ